MTGYDKLRERISSKAAAGNGDCAPGTKPAPGPDTTYQLGTISSDLDKKVGSLRMMEVFSGAVEHIDFQIGRVIEAIDQLGDIDNTLIIYGHWRQRP